MIDRNIIIAKAGGTAGKNSVNYKISLPAEMVKALGVTSDDKAVTIDFENDKIIIKENKELTIGYQYAIIKIVMKARSLTIRRKGT